MGTKRRFRYGALKEWVEDNLTGMPQGEGELIGAYVQRLQPLLIEAGIPAASSSIATAIRKFERSARRKERFRKSMAARAQASGTSNGIPFEQKLRNAIDALAEVEKGYLEMRNDLARIHERIGKF